MVGLLVAHQSVKLYLYSTFQVFAMLSASQVTDMLIIILFSFPSLQKCSATAPRQLIQRYCIWSWLKERWTRLSVDFNVDLSVAVQDALGLGHSLKREKVHVGRRWSG